MFRRIEKVVWIIGAELHRKRAIEGGVSVKMPLRGRQLRDVVCVGRGGYSRFERLEMGIAVFGLSEHFGVEHGRIGEEIRLLQGRKEGA